MAKDGNPSFTRRLKEKIEKNEREINELKEEVKRLEEELQKTHHGDYQTKINELKKEIERLQEENDALREKIKNHDKKIGELQEGFEFLEEENKSIQQENRKLEERLKSTEKQLKKHNEELEKIKLSEDELVIRQLCSKVQENILRIVLVKHFDKSDNKIVAHIEKYISMQIEDVDEQKEANSRWEKLQKEIKWDSFWIEQLRQVKDRGNLAAHPDLTEEKINVAKMNLKKKEEFGNLKVKAVDQLKDMLKKTNHKLPRHGSEEGQDQGSPRYLSFKGQDQDTSANKKSKGARGPGFYTERPTIIS